MITFNTMIEYCSFLRDILCGNNTSFSLNIINYLQPLE
ncbi:hypothetical protein J5U23_00096 [Saccharolobus shibatae B12]|uniref:Uncharacterized protein n=1 Tax=Saccharolobus shibatae (strain ATCC 51178 / DSM 5389 / JCM 8931 / NBRC 15437 / B12) TaxID=523848 RepID=A0A8F5BLC8_SACSH|nr:hypothetical protein J5U23_00096 [Saccharolobus shibatae B12]